MDGKMYDSDYPCVYQSGYFQETGLPFGFPPNCFLPSFNSVVSPSTWWDHSGAIKGDVSSDGSANLSFQSALRKDAGIFVNEQKSVKEEDEEYNEKVAKLLKKQSVVQEKNRQAQKRFRQKQKEKMANLTDEVLQLRSKVAKMKAENENLINQNTLLNKVLEMKEDHMSLLQENVLEDSVYDNDIVMEGPEKNNNNNIGVGSKKEKGNFSPKSLDNSIRHESNNLQYKNISPETLKQVWKEEVQKMSKLIVKIGSEPANDNLKMELRHIVHGLSDICCKTATFCPESMRQLMAQGSIPDDCLSTALPAHEDSINANEKWKSILNCIELKDLVDMSPKQESKLLELYQMFCFHMKAIWTERAMLNRRFQECISVASSDMIFSNNFLACKLSSEINKIMLELKNSCYRESQYHMDFLGSFFKYVLTDFQIAKVFVQSYPLYPDILLMANVLSRHTESCQ